MDPRVVFLFQPLIERNVGERHVRAPWLPERGDRGKRQRDTRSIALKLIAFRESFADLSALHPELTQFQRCEQDHSAENAEGPAAWRFPTRSFRDHLASIVSRMKLAAEKEPPD